MRPVSEFRDQLFLSAGADPNRVVEFACGHVVPGEQIMPVALAQGPSNITLNFTYEHRSDPKVVSAVLAPTLLSGRSSNCSFGIHGNVIAMVSLNA